MCFITRSLTIVCGLCLLVGAHAQRPSDSTLRPKYDEAEKLYADGRRLGERDSVESKRMAIQKFESAIAIYLALGSGDDAATALYNAAFLCHNDGVEENAKALLLYEQALQLERKMGDVGDEALILNQIGYVWKSVGDKQKALDFFNQALRTRRGSGLVLPAADSLTAIGSLYETSGEMEKAVDHYEQALLLRREGRDRKGEARSLRDIGDAYGRLGQNRKAIENYEEALKIEKERGDVDGQKGVLNRIGTAYDHLGESKKALDILHQFLLLSVQSRNLKDQAAAVSNIAGIHLDLGELERALGYYELGLIIFQVVKDRGEEATLLNNIGRVHDELGDKQQAISYINRALLITREMGDREGEAIPLRNLGRVYSDLGDQKKAIDYFGQALPIARSVGNRKQEGLILLYAGEAFSAQGDFDKAVDHLNRALPLLRDGTDRAGEARALKNSMYVWNAKGLPNLAIAHGKQMVNIYESMRQSVKSLDKRTQRTYLQKIEGDYRKLAEILIKQGRIAEAEEILATLKDEEFSSYLQRDSSVAKYLKGQTVTLSPAEQKALDEYEKYSAEITRTAAAFEVLDKKRRDLKLKESLSAADQIEWERLKVQTDNATAVFSTFLQSLKARFGNNNAQVAAVTSDTIGLLKSLKEPRTVIVSTITGEDRLSLIVTTSSIQKAHSVEVRAEELNRLVLEIREAVKSPRVDPRGAGKKLYDKLFPPEMQNDLANIKADTIIWSLDGTLRYVPMAALYDGEYNASEKVWKGQYLAQRYQQAVITLASRGKLGEATATSSANWQALGVGVSKEVPGEFSALPAVPRELCSVVADADKKVYCDQYGAKGVFDGLMLPDDEFTLTSFEGGLGKTAVVHVASHFALNSANQTDSFLLLGGGTERRFSLDRLQKTRLDNIELLTLSACNTAMAAGNTSNGAEVEHFGATAINNGAKSVLATLWAVADESTQLLMTEFYQLKKMNPAMTKAAALRAAQLEMIGGKLKSKGGESGCRAKIFGSSRPTDFKCDPNAPFTHPYFWAPFVLIGNWR